MAERLDEFEFRSRGGAHFKYPWQEWFDGKIWKIHASVDFRTNTFCMRAQIYVQAARHGLRVHVNIVDEGKAIVFRTYPKADKP